MDKYYFLLRGIDKTGPFLLEQLKQQKLLADDLVWCHEYGETWIRVDEIENLKNNFILAPPPSPFEINKNIRDKEIRTVIVFFLAVFVIIGILAFGALYDLLVYSVKHRYHNDIGDVFLYSFIFISLPLSIIVASIKHSAIIKKYFKI
jgi:hypothetical protein